MPRKVEISHRTIIFSVLFIIFLWFLYFLKDLILSLFVALLIMVILNPLVKKLSKFRVPRGLAILVVYVVAIGTLGFSLGSLVPPLIEQTSNFTISLPAYLENLQINSPIGEQISRQVLNQIGTLPGRILDVVQSIISNFITVLTILTFAFYLLLARNNLESQLSFLVGDKKSKEIGDIIDELEIKLGGWARGQLVLMVTVGIFTYIGLSLLQIRSALPLAVLAGLLEALPYIGPIVAGIPAVIIGLGVSPLMGLATFALAFLIQQLENYVLVPKIMERSVGVSPLVTLISLAVGFKLAGITGVLISVPVVITLRVLAQKHFLSKITS